MKLNELIKINEDICKENKYPSGKEGLALLIECIHDNSFNHDLIDYIDLLYTVARDNKSEHEKELFRLMKDLSKYDDNSYRYYIVDYIKDYNSDNEVLNLIVYMNRKEVEFITIQDDDEVILNSSDDIETYVKDNISELDVDNYIDDLYDDYHIGGIDFSASEIAHLINDEHGTFDDLEREFIDNEVEEFQYKYDVEIQDVESYLIDDLSMNDDCIELIEFLEKSEEVEVMKLNKDMHILDEIADYIKGRIFYLDEITGEWVNGDCVGLSFVHDCGLIDMIYSNIQSYLDDVGVFGNDDDTINLIYERVSNLYIDELKNDMFKKGLMFEY